MTATARFQQMADRDEQRYYYAGDLPCHTEAYNPASGEWDVIEYSRSFSVKNAYHIQQVLAPLVELGILSMTAPKKES